MADTSQVVDFPDFQTSGSRVNIFDDHYGSNVATRVLHSAPNHSIQLVNHSKQPRQFVAQLATQIQLLACLKWLGEFQVLPFIPICGSISASEVAGLAGVPTTQLSRIVRMAATTGFLCQSQQDEITHTPLSRAFVVDLSLLDAVMFLAEKATPVALSMPTATQDAGKGSSPGNSAFSMAMNSSQTFQAACADQGRLRRQWSAFCQCADDVGDSFLELLGRMNWESLGNVQVVDACAHSTEIAAVLVNMYPNIRFIVQMIEPRPQNTPRITVQRKTSSAVQTVKGAAVYILRLSTLRSTVVEDLHAELNAHLVVLQANPAVVLIVAPPLLPEPGSVHPDVEATARFRDLSNIQMSNEGGGMEFSEFMKLVSNVRDQYGRLVVMQKLHYRNETIAAVTIRYELYVNSASGIM